MSKPERASVKLEKYLRNIGEFYKFCRIFTPERTLSEIFLEIWDRKDLNILLSLPNSNEKINVKSEAISENFRNQGNRLYVEKKFDKSLIAYNMAIVSAPHPKLSYRGVKPNEKLFEALSLAFSNRSALLFEVGMYNESLEDINRAIDTGYPENKVYKLEERAGKCLLKMNKKKEAERSFRTLLEKVLKSSAKDSVIESLEGLIKQCSLNEQPEGISVAVWYKHIFHRGPEFPIFSKKPSDESINYASSSIKIHYSKSRGRHLVSTRDIEPGEVLLVERAFCSIVKINENIRSYCCVCLRKASIVIPCDTCALVVFCSEECSLSPNNHHNLECSNLPVLVEVNPDEELGLVFRALLRFTWEQIDLELKEQKEIRNKSKEEFDSKVFKSLLTFKYKYSHFSELEGNLDKRSGDSFLEAAANAVVGVKLLKNVPSFWMKDDGSSYEQTNERLIALGAEIMKLLLNFQCNIHCVKELSIDPSVNILSASCYESGYGIYSAFSMMNHSCAPNALHSNWGDTKFMYSVDFIPKGQEIFDSYGERYVSHELARRIQNLKDIYYFKCSCIACTEEWPVFTNLPRTFSLICIECKTPLSPSSACETCNKVYVKTRDKTLKVYDAHNIEDRIKAAWNNYELALKDISKYRVSFAIVKKIGRYISLLSKHTGLPHAPFVEAQEVLLRCFDLMGSFTFTDSLCDNK